MKNWLGSLFVGCAFIVSSSRAAEESGELKPESRKVAESEVVEFIEPDGLVPVESSSDDWHIAYVKDLTRYLKLNEPFELRMVIRPSFSGESVVSLGKVIQAKAGKGQSSRWVISYLHCTSEKNIWYSMRENSNEQKQLKVTIAEKKVNLPDGLAERVLRLWKLMLTERTARRFDGAAGLDGTIFEFSIPGKSGESWSPQQPKSPLLFTELGGSLIDYCKAEGKERTVVLKSIEEKAAALEQYLKNHPLEKAKAEK